MTNEEIFSKIEYRQQKRDWCIQNGRQKQAEWNQQQIDNLERMFLLNVVDEFNDISIEKD